MVRAVSEAEFKEACENLDNLNVAWKVVRSFHLQEPDHLVKLAIWRTLRAHEPGRQKFTSSLFRWARWTCLQHLKEKSLPTSDELEPSFVPDDCHDFEEIERLLQPLPKKERNLVYQHVILGVSFRELARRRKMSLSGVFYRFQQSLSKLKELHGVCG